MRETLLISYRGETIAVELVEEISGDHDDLYEFEDYLLRDSDGRYYLRQTRSMQMPPNAEELYSKRMFALRSDRAGDALEIRRLRAWRRQLTKRRTTIKRITEKTALLWLLHQSFNDKILKARLRDAVIATFRKGDHAL
ncbi:MAG TPA: hypothetical protein VGM65_14520 [Candidatus Udaeobacter sp.]